VGGGSFGDIYLGVGANGEKVSLWLLLVVAVYCCCFSEDQLVDMVCFDGLRVAIYIVITSSVVSVSPRVVVGCSFGGGGGAGAAAVPASPSLLPDPPMV